MPIGVPLACRLTLQRYDARRLIELGISEIGIGYPRDAAQRPIFEAIAREVIPRLKEEFSARQ
jgi:hypothetical protein